MSLLLNFCPHSSQEFLSISLLLQVLDDFRITRRILYLFSSHQNESLSLHIRHALKLPFVHESQNRLRTLTLSEKMQLHSEYRKSTKVSLKKITQLSTRYIQYSWENWIFSLHENSQVLFWFHSENAERILRYIILSAKLKYINNKVQPTERFPGNDYSHIIPKCSNWLIKILQQYKERLTAVIDEMTVSYITSETWKELFLLHIETLTCAMDS